MAKYYQPSANVPPDKWYPIYRTSYFLRKYGWRKTSSGWVKKGAKSKSKPKTTSKTKTKPKPSSKPTAKPKPKAEQKPTPKPKMLPALPKEAREVVEEVKKAVKTATVQPQKRGEQKPTASKPSVSESKKTPASSRTIPIPKEEEEVLKQIGLKPPIKTGREKTQASELLCWLSSSTRLALASIWKVPLWAWLAWTF